MLIIDLDEEEVFLDVEEISEGWVEVLSYIEPPLAIPFFKESA